MNRKKTTIKLSIYYLLLKANSKKITLKASAVSSVYSSNAEYNLQIHNFSVIGVFFIILFLPLLNFKYEKQNKKAIKI